MEIWRLVFDSHLVQWLEEFPLKVGRTFDGAFDANFFLVLLHAPDCIFALIQDGSCQVFIEYSNVT